MVEEEEWIPDTDPDLRLIKSNCNFRDSKSFQSHGGESRHRRLLVNGVSHYCPASEQRRRGHSCPQTGARAFKLGTLVCAAGVHCQRSTTLSCSILPWTGGRVGQAGRHSDNKTRHESLLSSSVITTVHSCPVQSKLTGGTRGV